MTSKEKEKTFQEKLKNFFRINKAGTGNFKGRENFALTSDVVKDLSPESPLNQRVKIMKEMSEAVLKNHIEESAVEKLWACLKDLFHPDIAKEHRHLAFTFFGCLVQGQYEKLGIMRSHFFRLIKTHDVAEDVAPRFELLQSLTENGKDIKYFEEEVGPFLMQWMPAITGVGKTQQFLAVWVNVIKFNAAYVDEEVIKELVQNTCFLCCWSNSQPVVLTCLQVLDTVVCYTNLPSQSITTFIIALCRTVNVEAYCQTSWKIMRNLLGTHLGHSALYTMCRILQDTSSQHDVHLLRGAVFYVNMALWGTKRVTTLKYTATSVLPSFLAVLSSNNSIVMYEVMLSIQRLVNKFGLELKDPAWDLVLSIMEAIIEHIETDSRTSPASQVTSTLHDTICTIEQLMELGQFHGSVRRVFELIERCSPVRPEASVLRLITFLSSNIIPIRSDWIQRLHSLVDKYFKQETRTTIRVRALDVLSNVISLNRPAYEDELIELIVIPQLQHIESDPDILVRTVAAQLLVHLALECENKRCLELLDILDKLLNRPLEQQGDVPITSEQDVADVKTVVVGLINIFTSKLFQLPSSHAIKAYKLLVGHLEAHYLKPAVFELVSSTRYLIFECFLRLRANSLYGLGYPDSVTGQVRFSPYLLVDHKEGERTGGGGSSPPPMSPAPTTYPTCTVTQLSLIQACKLVIACLRQERDWKVLSLILQEVPQVMKNKALILSHHSNEIDLLASALCAMVSDKSLGLPESLQNTPPKFTRSEFHTFVLPVLASLASYHGYLDPGHQQRLIKCLEFGLVSRCSRQCVMALTICALEMKDAMYKLLPEVLLNLSKISATVHIAIPLLEFLSTLTRLPKVFASFVGDQYMSVFAISLPYTNPFKYNHYTVSLAHHVIAVWFLKCRLPFRRDFVKFITTGLKANVIVPFEEGQLIMKSDLINEDSSSRKRSSSLTEQGSRRSLRTVGVRPEGRPGDLKPPIDEALMNFHMELTETCIDLMARYTFSTCSAQPKRLPTAEFLLSGGQSMTWILGNRVITVTTSGCSQKVLKNGLCDKCWMLCRPDKESVSPDVLADQEPQSGKQLQKSTNQRPVSNDVGPGSKDSRSFVTPDSSIISAPVEDIRKTLAAPDTHEPEPHRLEQIVFGSNEPEKQERQFCACWCQGWAEIHIRRPTGDVSWAMRIQNQCYYQSSPLDFPLADITTLFMPSLAGKKEDLMSSHKRINSETLAESEYDAILDQHFEHTPDDVGCTSHVLGMNTGPSGPILIPGSPLKRSISRQNSRESLDNETDCYDTDGRSRNPVRRSNSSPEMSASWKNPFMNRDKEREGKPLPLPLDREDSGEMETKQDNPTEAKKPAKLSKDPRVSCEAIPEESAGQGTTPPQPSTLVSGTTNQDGHPPLASCHSYPGTLEDGPERAPVPPSPTSVTSPAPLLSTPTSSATHTGVFNTRSVQPLALQQRLPQTKEVKSSPDIPRLSQSRQHVTTSTTPTTNTSSASTDKLSVKEEPHRPDPSALPPLAFKRGRGHTISVMSPIRKPPRLDWSNASKESSPRNKETPRSGISPSFIFLQLYHAAHFGNISDKPLLLSQSQVVQRALKNLDRIPPYETHKIGVLYVGGGQASQEADILNNQFGSLRYTEFLQRLGTLISLKDADIFLGGLDRNGNDGKFAYVWQDDVMQVTFHVATLMPNKETDPSGNGKKLHIGNDFVTIVYNESGEDYNMQTVKILLLVLPCVLLLGLCSGIEVTEKIIEHISPNMTHVNITTPHTERITTPLMEVPPVKERDTASALPQKDEKKFIPSPMLGSIPDPEFQQPSKSNPDHEAYLQQEHMKLLKYKYSQDKTNPKLKTGLSFPPNPHLLKMFHDHKSREVPRNNKNKNDDTHKSADTEYDYLKLFKDYMSDSNPQDIKTPQKESFTQEDYFKYMKNQELPMNDGPIQNSGKNVPYDENIFKALQNPQNIPEHRQIAKEEFLKDISSYKNQPSSDDNFDIEDILKAIDQYKAQPEENQNLFDNGHFLKSTQNFKPPYISDENSNDQNVFNILQNGKLQHNSQHQQIGKEEFLKDISSYSNQDPAGGSLSIEEILKVAQNYKPQPEEYNSNSGDFPKSTTNFNPHYNSDESFNGKYLSKPIPKETPQHIVHPGSFSNEGYNPGTFIDAHVSIPPRGQQPIFTSSGKFESDIKSTSFTSSPVTNSHPYTFQIAPAPAERPGKKQAADTHSSQKGPNTMSMLKKAVSLLATFIPLGLFLASISPSILHINSTQSNLPHRQRSLDGATKMDDLEDPLLAIIDKYGGAKSLDDPDCENRIFCEMTRLGKQPEANLVQRSFWYLANDTPSSVAESLGLREVFKAVRTDACNIYNCVENINITNSTQPINS